MDRLIEETTSPTLISTGEIKDISELCLVSKGMVVSRFRPASILAAVTSLLGYFYCLKMEFPFENSQNALANSKVNLHVCASCY